MTELDDKGELLYTLYQVPPDPASQPHGSVKGKSGYLQPTLISAGIFLVLVGLMLVGYPLVQIALTAKWTACVPVLRLLCVLAIMRSLGTIMPALVSALGHPRMVFRFNLVSVLILPFAFAAAARWAGIEGVGAAWLLVYAPMWLWLFHFTLKLTDTPAWDYLRRLLLPAGCTATCGDLSRPVRKACALSKSISGGVADNSRQRATSMHLWGASCASRTIWKMP